MIERKNSLLKVFPLQAGLIIPALSRQGRQGRGRRPLGPSRAAFSDALFP